MNEKKEKATIWFKSLRDSFCQAFEHIEKNYALERGGTPGTFKQTPWDRPEGGGGVMALMNGQVFEKVGVNISVVHGEFTEKFRQEMPHAALSPAFWAAGVSLVAHMMSPLVPAVHMNTRMIINNKCWFGGGADMTPYFPIDDDTNAFHLAFEDTCNRYDPLYYSKFKKACDDYFYLKHRSEPRGIGGIFYDYHDTGNWETDFQFTQDVGRTLLKVYPPIVTQHMYKPWSEDQRHHQLVRRGRYVEFNLLYDRGTRFGLETNGYTEAIFMSMPPIAKWV